jgi:hypothetical protein
LTLLLTPLRGLEKLVLLKKRRVLHLEKIMVLKKPPVLPLTPGLVKPVLPLMKNHLFPVVDTALLANMVNLVNPANLANPVNLANLAMALTLAMALVLMLVMALAKANPPLVMALKAKVAMDLT